MYTLLQPEAYSNSQKMANNGFISQFNSRDWCLAFGLVFGEVFGLKMYLFPISAIVILEMGHFFCMSASPILSDLICFEVHPSLPECDMNFILQSKTR